MRRRSLFLLPVVVGATASILALAASETAFAATSSVIASDFRYSPSTITIHAGDAVVWTSHGPSPHTVTADGGSFGSGTLGVGGSFSHTFATAGTFAYHCQFHQSLGMVGTVVVLGASGSPGGAGPLPNTGAGPRVRLLFGMGILFLSAGAVLLVSGRGWGRA